MCILAMTTLILSAVMIVSTCYTYFDNQLKKEIESETRMAADFFDTTEMPRDKLSEISVKDKRITLIDKNGNVLYDTEKYTNDNHNSRPEIKEAKEKGIGTSKRYSKTVGKSLHYCAVKLSNGEIIRISSERYMPSMFYTILLAVFFITGLMYLFCAIIASRLTDSIVRPIEKINLLDEKAIDNTYEEIKPFLKKISNQNREINRQESKVTEQKARLRAIMDNINEGLVITDKSGIILSANTPALTILNINQKDVKNRKLSSVTKSEKIHKVLLKALSGEKNNIMYEANERSYQIFYSPVYEQGEVSGSVLLIFDVTERTNTEKIRREFTANVSHELKTPLTTIHGYSQIIDSGIAKPEDISGFIKKIEKESSRLMALVDDIIALSHIDEATNESPKEKFLLKEAVSEACDALSQKAKQRDVSFEVVCDDSYAYANKAQAVEIIFNLCDNAIKYNKPMGSVKVSVEDSTVTVTDTGIGIPEKYYDRVFERFFRVDKSHSKKVNGTGLGLSIVKHLAIINNAELNVKSTLGEGSTFTVTFRKDAEFENNI